MLFAILIVKEPDFGTAAIVVAVTVAMLFVAGLSYRYVIGVCLAFVPVAMMLVFNGSYQRSALRRDAVPAPKKARATCDRTLRSCRKIIYLPPQTGPSSADGQVSASKRGLQ